MDNYWSLTTHGDPLGKVQEFIKYVWRASSLDGMLVTVNGAGHAHATPKYVTDTAFIDQINPFKPLMEINAARLAPRLLATHPGARLGAVLRPCEMRALIEMAKHTQMNLEHLLTISVDCLGTIPADEYQWRLERIQKNLPSERASSSDELAHEALKFARQGGIIPYRYRSACQVCAFPAAQQAQININVLGLPVRQQILVSVSEPKIADAVGINDYANALKEETLVLQHERILSRMKERHERTMDRLTEGLGSLLPTDVDALVRQLESCGDCQRCMEVCPICSVDRPRRDAHGHYDLTGVMRWLVSCAGCGMCEQSCPNHLPTAAIFAHIRQQLDQLYVYTPGNSINDQLPLILM